MLQNTIEQKNQMMGLVYPYDGTPPVLNDGETPFFGANSYGSGNGITSSVSSFGWAVSRGALSQAVSNLFTGSKWGGDTPGTPVTVTYSLSTSASVFSYGPGGIQDLNAAQKAGALSAMQKMADICCVTFKAVTETSILAGDIRWTQSNASSIPTAYAYYPNVNAAAGDIWIGPNYPNSYGNPVAGGYGYLTYIHELGHALGLSHPHDPTGGAPNPVPAEDQLKYSIMSYKDFAGDSNNGYNSEYFPSGPMLNDIAALQYMYGANTAYHAGNDTYSWAPDATIINTIWDGGGTDLIDASNQSAGVVLRLTSGEWSQIGKAYWNGSNYVRDNLTIAYGAVIENAIGSMYADSLYGNAAANTLTGGDGADILDGGAGNDLLMGGAGDDVYLFSAGSGNDIIREEHLASGQYGTIRLAALSKDKVAEARAGNDLVLSWSDGGAGKVTIEGYFVSGGTWRVEDRAATLVDIQTLLPPQLSSAVATITAEGCLMTLAFDQTLDGAVPPKASAFVVKVDGKAIKVNSVAFDGVDASKVQLALSGTLHFGQQVTVSYKDPGKGNDVKDVLQSAQSGMDVSSLVDVTVENRALDDHAAPTLAAAACAGAVVTLRMSEALDSHALPSASAFSVQVSGKAAKVQAVEVSNVADGHGGWAGEVHLTLAGQSGLEDKRVDVNYTDPSVKDDVKALQDIYGNDAGAMSLTLAPDGMDVIAPTMSLDAQSSQFPGQGRAYLLFTFNDQLAPIAEKDLVKLFSVKMDGKSVTPVAATLVSNSHSSFVALYLSKPLLSGSTVDVTYKDKTVYDDAVALQDLTGNDVADHVWTNYVGLLANNHQAPAPVSAILLNANTIRISFKENGLDLAAAEDLIDAKLLPTLSTFTVTQGKTKLNVVEVKNENPEQFIGARYIDVKLSAPVEGGGLKVAYKDPSAKDDVFALQDHAGNDVASFTMDVVASAQGLIDLVGVAQPVSHLLAGIHG